MCKPKEENKLFGLGSVQQNIANMLDRITDGIVSFNNEWNYVYLNTRAANMLGVEKPEDLLGKNYWNEFPEAKNTPFAKAYKRAMKTQEVMAVESFYEPWQRWFENRIYPSKEGLTIYFTEITQEKKEEELARERLKLTIQAANIGLWDWDLKTNSVIYSEEWKGQLGYKDHEISNTFSEWEKRVHPEDLARAKATIESFLKKPYSHFQNEFRMRHKNGSYIWILAQASLLADNTGKPYRMLGSHIDITKQKKAEQRLKRNEELLRLFIKHSPAAIAMFDREMRYIAASRRYLADYGLDGLDLTGRSHYDVFPEIPQRWKEIHQRCLAGATEKAEEDPFPRSDGRVDWVRWEIHPWRHPNHEIGGIVLFSEVITERKMAREAILNERNFSDEALNSLPGIFYMYDEGLNFMRWNNNFKQVSGYGDAEIARMSPLDFFATDEKELLAARIEKVFSTGAAEVEADFLSKGGTRTPYYFTGKKITVAGQNCLIGVGVDISKRKNAELEILKLNKELEQRVVKRTKELTDALQQAREAENLKSVFLASMSHELRTPLNSIIGFTGILLMELAGGLNTEQKKQLRIVKNNSQHLLSMINDILDISKIEAGKVEIERKPFKLKKTVAEILDSFRPNLREAGIKLIVDFPANITMHSDERRIKQILINLISNAVKYTYEGEVKISVRPQATDRLIIKVSDTGIGITKEDMKRLFKPFQQLDFQLTKKYEGTGLGLYLSEKLTGMLGGSIHAESTPGKGSMFTVILPVKRINDGTT